MGKVEGSATKIQKYLGEFVIDLAEPYRLEAAPGANGARLVVVFRLLPVDGASLLADYVGPIPLEPSSEPIARRVPAEIDSTHFYETGPVGSRTAIRVESALVKRFMNWRGDGLMDRWAIRIPSENITLLTDVYDPVDHVLYEAKASSGRGNVRMALGQLLDYKRHVDVADLRTRLLVPERPNSDLVDLIRRNHVGLAYATDGPGFVIED